MVDIIFLLVGPDCTHLTIYDRVSHYSGWDSDHTLSVMMMFARLPHFAALAVNTWI